MKIAVGLSGGVDSSVTAYLLKEAGHDVIGITMAIWDDTLPLSNSNNGMNKVSTQQPVESQLSFIKGTMKKNSCFGPDEKSEIEETRTLCRQIDIPFHVIDCAKEYNAIVLTYFKNEYLLGRTPNPCIKCNQLIKFGVLLHTARKSGITFDLFSTGHYTRVEGDVHTRRYILKKAVDSRKDQSYFLYRLTQNQLSRIFFPLGHYFKEQVRDIAKQKGLPVHDREESQDFYGGSYSDLLDVEDKTGNIIDRYGNILGKHKGIWNYTRGQRRGLGVAAGKPLYVIDINAETNEIIAGYEEESYNKGFYAEEVNWIAIELPDKEIIVHTKVRSTQIEKKATLIPCNEKRVKVVFHEPQKAIAPGQSAVFYKNEIVLGGGIIDKVF